jgi:hypothetical protein
MGLLYCMAQLSAIFRSCFTKRLIRKTEGSVEVENEIQVIPVVLQADAAIERKVKEIVQTDSRFQGVSISVTFKTGAVNVIITLNYSADVLFLKKQNCRNRCCCYH